MIKHILIPGMYFGILRTPREGIKTSVALVWTNLNNLLYLTLSSLGNSHPRRVTLGIRIRWGEFPFGIKENCRLARANVWFSGHSGGRR